MIVPIASSRARLSFLLLKIVQGEKTLGVTLITMEMQVICPEMGVFRIGIFIGGTKII